MTFMPSWSAWIIDAITGGLRRLTDLARSIIDAPTRLSA
jgi:hypothetical protein